MYKNMMYVSVAAKVYPMSYNRGNYRKVNEPVKHNLLIYYSTLKQIIDISSRFSSFPTNVSASCFNASIISTGVPSTD
jgi:hypothetical protein